MNHEEEKPEPSEKEIRLRIDEMAEFHARLSALESGHLRLSRRVTHIEDSGRGGYSDDPMDKFFSPGFIWLMAIVTLAPIIIEVWQKWKSSSSSDL